MKISTWTSFSTGMIAVVSYVAMWQVAAGASDELQKPRIALLLSADGRHHDEFDNALKTLGWTADRFPSKPENMKSLAGKLGDYDMLISAPLFNFQKDPVLPGDDRAAYKKFIEDGGLIAITDGSYDGVRAWLADIDPAFGGLEPGKCNSSPWTVNGVTKDATTPHPLRFFPFQIEEPNSWPHFQNPAAGSKWQVVAYCSEGSPATLAQRVGKGMASISALRQPSAKQLGNFYACQQLCRAGILLKSFEMPAPGVGEGRLRLEFSDSGARDKCSFVYEVVAENGKMQRFEQAVSGTVFELPYRISLRGPVTARLLVNRGGQRTLLFSQDAVLPQLLTVTPNAYRGILSTARRLPDVRFGIELAPDQEELQGTKVRLRVFDPNGKQVAETKTPIETEGPVSVSHPVPLSQNLKAGDYRVEAVLTRGDNTMAQSEARFTILVPAKGQTIIDEDNTLLVEGKPYFPVGLYHVQPSDYNAVASLGINTVQYWVWHDLRGLDEASKHGLKAVFELNHKSERIVREIVAKFGGKPAIMMWYGLDEPAEGSYGLATAMRDTFHQCDDQRPVYSLSCRPDLFAVQARFSDVFAHDPYGKPQKALDWMQKAVAAVDRRKPVICVPGAFGKETAEELRATAYLALAQDARGILWYPWCQEGGGPVGIGLKNSPEQQTVIKQLCTEINELKPALTAPVRYPFASADGKLQGIYCVDASKRYLVLVNGTPQKIQAEAVLPGEEKVDRDFHDFFKKHSDVLSVKSNGFRISLEAYDTRAYQCD